MYLRTISVLNLVLLLVVTGAFGQGVQRVPDPNFDAKVVRPAYPEKHPKVLFDEAHFNPDRSSKYYKSFFDLVSNDGYAPSVNKEKFSPQTLQGYDVLVIVDAAGARGDDYYDAPAFTEEECNAVRDWVNSGGALLLIAGRAPFGKAGENLAKRFGVEMSNGMAAIDKANSDPETPTFSIRFTRENNFLMDHAIIQGRDSTERINYVLTYGGQSLKGPEGSAALLKLSGTAVEIPGISKADILALKSAPKTESPSTTTAKNGVPQGAVAGGKKERVSVAGRAQAVALTFGKGRVVILGESDLFTAQLLQGQIARMKGKEAIPIGMNAPGNDNRQFALNIMHWLSGLLPAGDTSPKTAVMTSGLNVNSTNQSTKLSNSSAPTQKKKLLAPTFTGVSLDGKQFDLAALRGKVVVLNLWFLGCPPCIAEIPDLNKLVDDYKGKNVVFLSLALDDENSLREFLKNREFKYHLVPNATDIIMGQYGVSVYPTHIIVDKEGRMDAELLGKNSFKGLREGIDRTLKQ